MCAAPEDRCFRVRISPAFVQEAGVLDGTRQENASHNTLASAGGELTPRQLPALPSKCRAPSTRQDWGLVPGTPAQSRLFLGEPHLQCLAAPLWVAWVPFLVSVVLWRRGLPTQHTPGIAGLEGRSPQACTVTSPESLVSRQGPGCR